MFLTSSANGSPAALSYFLLLLFSTHLRTSSKLISLSARAPNLRVSAAFFMSVSEQYAAHFSKADDTWSASIGEVPRFLTSPSSSTMAVHRLGRSSLRRLFSP